MYSGGVGTFFSKHDDFRDPAPERALHLVQQDDLSVPCPSVFYMQRFSIPEIYKSDMFPGMERECMEKTACPGDSVSVLFRGYMGIEKWI